MAKITLKMIAEQSGVSYAAVSQVLSNPNHSRFSHDTRERILNVAKKLNYRPNRFAMALKGQSTNLFSMVLPWNCPELMDSAERGAREAGYQLMVEFTPSPVDGAEAKAINTALDWNVDGLIWMPYGGTRDYSDTIGALRASSVKVVFLHHGLDELDGAETVMAETVKSTVYTVEHLVEQGYKRIVCLSDQLDFAPDQKRFSLIRQTANELGIPSQTTIIAPSDFKKEMSSYLRAHQEPVAMICNGNWFAVDLIELSEELDIDCPQRLGIVAIGDYPVGGRIRVGTMTRPQLTAIQEPLDLMASAAIDVLVSRVKGEVSEIQTEILFPEKLVIRESTLRLAR